MAKYVLAYHNDSPMPPDAPVDDGVMQAWMAWFTELGPAVLDIGNPTSIAKTVQPDGTVTDGGGANPLTGYTLLEADSLDAAAAMAQGCPVLAAGGSVEVAEAIPM